MSKFPFSIQGRSRSADRTGFFIKELKLALDAGMSRDANPRVMCIPPTHSDHAGALPMICPGQAVPWVVYCPQACM